MGPGTAAPVRAEYMGEMEYCYNDQCYASLELAEAAMRADSVYGALLRRKAAVPANQTNNKNTYNYYVENQPAKNKYVTYSVGGFYVQPCQNSDPYSNNGCDQEDVAVNDWYSKNIGGLYSCTYNPVRTMGSHIEPFYQLSYVGSSNGQYYGVAYHFNISGATDTNTDSPPSWGTVRRAVIQRTCSAGTSYRLGVIGEFNHQLQHLSGTL